MISLPHSIFFAIALFYLLKVARQRYLCPNIISMCLNVFIIVLLSHNFMSNTLLVISIVFYTDLILSGDRK